MAPIVDREARNQAASVLRAFIAGRITNDDFEDRMPTTRDPAIWATCNTAWLLYSDMRRHRLTGPDALLPPTRREALRWIIFLDGEEPYVWPPRPHPGARHPRETGSLFSLGRRRRTRAFFAAGDYAAWPFADRADEARAKRAPRRLAGRT